jgi:hypothetical protein
VAPRFPDAPENENSKLKQMAGAKDNGTGYWFSADNCTGTGTWLIAKTNSKI